MTYRVSRARLARINAFLQETLSGIMVVQVFAQERKCLPSLTSATAIIAMPTTCPIFNEASLFSIVEAMSVVSIALMLWYGAGQVGQGLVALGTLVAFIEYIQKFFAIRNSVQNTRPCSLPMTAIERVVSTA